MLMVSGLQVGDELVYKTPALEPLTRNHSDISERRAKDVIYGRVLCLSVSMLLAES